MHAHTYTNTHTHTHTQNTHTCTYIQYTHTHTQNTHTHAHTHTYKQTHSHSFGKPVWISSLHTAFVSSGNNVVSASCYYKSGPHRQGVRYFYLASGEQGVAAHALPCEAAICLAIQVRVCHRLNDPAVKLNIIRWSTVAHDTPFKQIRLSYIIDCWIYDVAIQDGPLHFFPFRDDNTTFWNPPFLYLCVFSRRFRESKH